MDSTTLMNIPASKWSKSKKLKRYHQAVPAVLFSLLLLTGCQKSPDSEAVSDTPTDTETQTTPMTTNINVDTPDDNNESMDEPINDDSVQTTVNSELDISLTQLENDLGATGTIPNNAATAPNPEQAIKGAQITDVSYKSATGETLSVVFETSAAGTLNAIVNLPNKPKMTLSAPEGQGNNPTYRSKDGSIQLVSHAGGGSIDLIQNNKVTSFDAVSAEAEVITER